MYKIYFLILLILYHILIDDSAKLSSPKKSNAGNIKLSLSNLSPKKSSGDYEDGKSFKIAKKFFLFNLWLSKLRFFY